jgi:hypothetical protein
MIAHGLGAALGFMAGTSKSIFKFQSKQPVSIDRDGDTLGATQTGFAPLCAMAHCRSKLIARHEVLNLFGAYSRLGRQHVAERSSF